MMIDKKTYGLCLFQKETKSRLVLKDMLQLLRTQNPGRTVNFSYVEGESSLLPQLSLWENLQLETGSLKFSEIRHHLKPEWHSLLSLLNRPDTQVMNADHWEKLAFSLLKAVMGPAQNILIDMNEDLLSPFMIKIFKNACAQMNTEKSIVLASANTSLWLDCAHSLVVRRGFKFEVEKLNEEQLRAHWTSSRLTG